MDPTLLGFAGLGVVGGLVALGRGFVGYRAAAGISDTSPSRIASAAVGELLVTGVVEAAELTLVSPLQSTPCVYYRATIGESGDDTNGVAFHEERAVGFTLRDETGSLRVFPRGARFDVPTRFSEETGTFGETPPGLRLRTGPAFGPGADRDAQIAALLSVRPGGRGLPDDGSASTPGGFGLSLGSSAGRRSRRYREARIEPGEIVTVLGRALPFDQLDDPSDADAFDAGSLLLNDPEIAADLAAARAAGQLESDPAEAWGNAAIPGFGIGRPVSEPELDPEATVPALADAETATRYERTFTISPDALVLAASPEVPLLVSLGSPAAAAGRHRQAFIVGLLGAVVAIGSAMALALMIGGAA
jgi:hypothetical protein